MPQNPSALKRQKELARLDWQREKQEKRKQRKLEREQAKAAGLDPDLEPSQQTTTPVSPVSPVPPKQP